MSWEESLGRPPDITKSLQFRHGIFFVGASDIAGQFYCEMKVHNSFVLGRVETEEKITGSRIHEEVFPMKPIESQELIKKIKSGRLVISSFPLFAFVRGIVLAGRPDAVVSIDSKPRYLIELKTTQGDVSKLWEDQKMQLMLYALLLEENHFDIRDLKLALVRAKANLRCEREDLLAHIILHLIHTEPLNERIRRNVAFFYPEYDRKRVLKEIEWASEYWLGKREPVPTTKVAKCERCEYRNECPFSLVSKKKQK